MTYNKTKHLIYVLLTSAVILWIAFNPYTDIKFIENNPVIFDCINGFFSSIKLGYRFSIYDIYYVFMFTEYFIFGIMISGALKNCPYENTRDNILSVISMSVCALYFITYSNNNWEYLIGFSAICIGSVIYFLVSKFFSYSQKRPRYKTYKYERRR